jgi:probable rRNA maturation factor
VAVTVGASVGIEEPERWAELARSVLRAEGVAGPAELSLSFVDEVTMADLNHRWMGEDGPTDVLSWTIDAPDLTAPGRAAETAAEAPAADDEPALLGDVVVCPAVAARSAAAAGAGLGDELALLVVHGVLHVLGLDHAEPETTAAMQAREADHLTRFHDRRWTRSPS